MKFIIWIIIPVAITLVGCPKKSTVTSESTNSCSDRKKIVLVKLEQEKLFLCNNGLTVKEYDVALGKGGYGKKSAGDNKTPIGTYPLDKPEDSVSGFHKYIEIGYPTPQQEAQGYTGKEVGIHGPHEDWKWLGGATTWRNWTRGCVAVSSIREIEEISNWVESEKVSIVTLEL